MDVTLRLDAVGHVLPEGAVLRLSLSTSYWPLVWPAPFHTPIDVRPNKLPSW